MSYAQEWFTVGAVMSGVGAFMCAFNIVRGLNGFALLWLGFVVLDATCAGYWLAQMHCKGNGRPPVVERTRDGFVIDRLDPGESVELPPVELPVERKRGGV